MHSIWTLIIRPRAEAVLAQRVTVTTGSVKAQVIQLRSIYVILKDHEQELCVTLCMWSLLLLGRQWQETRKARQLLDRDYVKIADAQVVLPEDARVHSRPLEALPKDEQMSFLPRLLMVAYNRFGATRSVQDAAEAVRDECEFETASMDTKLSMVRFTAWAIPAVGFVGTVRGIGAALQEAQGAMGGDISGVTMGLGITFNATLTALVSLHHRDVLDAPAAAVPGSPGPRLPHLRRPPAAAQTARRLEVARHSAHPRLVSAARICASQITRRCARPRTAARGGDVIPLFVLDDHFFAPEAARRTPFRIQFLLESLASLAANLEHLGSRLILVGGRSVEQVPRLAQRWKVDRVVAQSWVAPIGRERDRKIGKALAVPLELFDTETLCPPGTLRTGAGDPFSVFTAFARAFARDVRVEPRRCRRRARCRRSGGRPHARRRAALARVARPRAQPARAGGGERNARAAAQGLAGARREGLRRAAQPHGPARHEPAVGGSEVRHAVGAHGVARGGARACANCRPTRCASTRTSCCGASSRTPRCSTGRSC